jgi:hypothetical protein
MKQPTIETDVAGIWYLTGETIYFRVTVIESLSTYKTNLFEFLF